MTHQLGDEEDTENFRVFVASWDCLGFESIIDITKLERAYLMSSLKNEDITPPSSILRNMILRARFNTHRSPQIWSFRSNMSQDSLWSIATESPQALADLIKTHGEKVFGEVPQKRVIE
jgi:hypothetical protein